MYTISKKLLLTIYGLFLVLAVHAQQQAPLEDVVNAFRNNRLGDIEKYYDNVVPITLNNSQSAYSRTQASLVMRDFFSRNNPTDFVVQNSGTPNPTSKFVVGEFSTPSGKFTFYVLMKSKDNNNTFMLQEIRLNKE